MALARAGWAWNINTRDESDARGTDLATLIGYVFSAAAGSGRDQARRAAIAHLTDKPYRGKVNGAGCRNRTRDIQFTKLALYQLS